MPFFKLILILYFISFAFMYYLTYKKTMPPVLPGDVYIRNSARRIYIPSGSSFYLAIILYLLLKTFAKI
jgi:hypothetical protein